MTGKKKHENCPLCDANAGEHEAPEHARAAAGGSAKVPTTDDLAAMLLANFEQNLANPEANHASEAARLEGIKPLPGQPPPLPLPELNPDGSLAKPKLPS